MIKVDAKGLACPAPVIKTKKAIESIDGGIVEVIVSGETPKLNVLKLAKSMNCFSKIIKEIEGEIVIHIEKEKGSDIVSDKKEAIESENNSSISKKDECIFITADKMGRGNDELGAVLIKGFIYALTEAEPYPKKILFVNSAITLTTTNEETVKNLKILEDAGVEIISCGTCLDYYNLKDQVKVGIISNMYTIVESLKEATNTITI